MYLFFFLASTTFTHVSFNLSQRNSFHIIFGAAVQMSGGSEYPSLGSTPPYRCTTACPLQSATRYILCVFKTIRCSFQFLNFIVFLVTSFIITFLFQISMLILIMSKGVTQLQLRQIIILASGIPVTVIFVIVGYLGVSF